MWCSHCGASARNSAWRRPCGGCSAARPSSSRRPSCGRQRRPSGSCRWPSSCPSWPTSRRKNWAERLLCATSSNPGLCRVRFYDDFTKTQQNEKKFAVIVPRKHLDSRNKECYSSIQEGARPDSPNRCFPWRQLDYRYRPAAQRPAKQNSDWRT